MKYNDKFKRLTQKPFKCQVLSSACGFTDYTHERICEFTQSDQSIELTSHLSYSFVRYYSENKQVFVM